MKKYIGVKIVAAEAVMKIDGQVYPLYAPLPASYENKELGYRVTYPDGYVSFSPKAVFDKTHLKMKEMGNKVSQADVDSFIVEVEDMVIGKKTTVVQATLKNGFTITESSSCVDPSNFDHEVGKEICLKRIQDKIWFLLGFLLQSGLNGFQAAEK